jgi:hypothetical protein
MKSLKFKMEYIRRIYDRYSKASRELKSKILDEVCKVCRWHRKHAVRVLAAPPRERGLHPRPGRSPVYGNHAIAILADIWKASGYLCGQRLAPALPLWLQWAKGRYALPSHVEEQLRRISPRQIDRRLARYKQKLKKRVYGGTKPGALLKRMIPVKTDHWDVKKPGFLEVDLVSHSGASADGTFAYTLNTTDIDTTWNARRALLGKSEVAVVDGMTRIERELPFPLSGIDSDNGSEFINHHLWAFCRKRPGRKVQFTRSREYKKDDNAHIEQKNWPQVRKILGWDRYDTPQAVAAINDLYDDLTPFQNFFQPSMKLKKKVRKGSRLIRRYDPPQTPFDRLKKSPRADPAKIRELQGLRDRLDPFELSRRIDRKIARVYALSSKRPSVPRLRPPNRPTPETPWRSFCFKNGARKHTLVRKALNRPFAEAA